ncbi:Enoyl-CoA hydratase 2, peroxisomal [Platanthera guangdongensis]|uniref:Enoyl-CoA hydratase 2, peroxisomal n=1 Tax=Platanthera guangdongensis TaxID=2320717 RepID=A0ABR2MMJ3_9ASPA
MARANSSSPIDPTLIISHKFPEVSFSYSERDVAIYALGVGACAGNAVDEKELKYVYARDGQQFIQVLPTFGSLFPFKNTNGLALSDVPSLDFDPRLLLHAQQYIEIYKPFPSNCTVKNKTTIAGLHDKGVFLSLVYSLLASIAKFFRNYTSSLHTTYLRGAGGFSKSSKPYSYASYPADQVSFVSVPKQKPSVIHEDRTQQSQALLYRLSGDYNPLHSDPMIASIAGFNRPILHGLCTLGFAVRAIITSVCEGDPNAVRSIFGRFLLHVFPGESLITEMWIQGQRYLNHSYNLLLFSLVL